jgi:hypothetical protein
MERIGEILPVDPNPDGSVCLTGRTLRAGYIRDCGPLNTGQIFSKKTLRVWRPELPQRCARPLQTHVIAAEPSKPQLPNRFIGPYRVAHRRRMHLSGVFANSRAHNFVRRNRHLGLQRRSKNSDSIQPGLTAQAERLLLQSQDDPHAF